MNTTKPVLLNSIRNFRKVINSIKINRNTNENDITQLYLFFENKRSTADSIAISYLIVPILINYPMDSNNIMNLHKR